MSGHFVLAKNTFIRRYLNVILDYLTLRLVIWRVLVIIRVIKSPSRWLGGIAFETHCGRRDWRRFESCLEPILAWILSFNAVLQVFLSFYPINP